MTRTHSILFAILGTSLLTAAADADAKSRPRHRPHRPPAEAVQACASRAEGDACSFTLHDKDHAGTCVTPPAPPDGDASAAPLVCLPDDLPPPHHGPPPEAFDACGGKAAGDACTVTHDDRTMDGTCKNGPDGDGPLACAPAHPPHDCPADK